jgi:single-strand DNA-binding protein
MSVTISLLGRLGSDVQLSTTNNGQTVAKVNVAVNHDRKNAEGNYDTDWYRLNVWGNRASNFANLFSKGKRVFATGSLEQGSYTNNNGELVITHDVQVSDFKVIDWEQQQTPAVQPQGQPMEAPTPQAMPQSQNQAWQQPQAPIASAPMAVNDDDLPF